MEETRTVPEIEKLPLLATAFPMEFPFYHLGRVEQGPAPVEEIESLEDRIGVAFSLQGDLSAALILLLDEGLDVSMYSELGNIVASRLASELNRRDNLAVAISAPRVLQRRQLERLIRPGMASAFRKSYIHHHDGRSIAVQMVIVPASREEAGHA